MKRIGALLAGVLLCLTGCTGIKVQDYASQSPKLDLRQYFNGKVEASGVFFSFSGKADPYFHVEMDGSWQGNDGKIAETFTYSDGRTEQRTWVVKFNDDGTFTGTAHDVIGTAIGAQSGNAMNMKYVLRVPVGDTTYDLSMDDWMYMMDENTVINRVKMKKFGVKVGELVVTFRKKS